MNTKQRKAALKRLKARTAESIEFKQSLAELKDHLVRTAVSAILEHGRLKLKDILAPEQSAVPSGYSGNRLVLRTPITITRPAYVRMSKKEAKDFRLLCYRNNHRMRRHTVDDLLHTGEQDRAIFSTTLKSALTDNN